MSCIAYNQAANANCMQLFYILSDPGMEDSLHGINGTRCAEPFNEKTFG
ncbi:hypothetical protein [Gynuella sunshinyii]|uniref:Uncharacterized protein n=1 Tax=Gynuella sunshinyii YC6258 TaxID=1445510 RepID=A0A0C5VD03_9GAMM|nr:hypothetical protein [Gynuella sunshinyii]AJQ97210.1 hypothetical Protein YC6258_05180 [Gynuella sunshinyii YC6258]